MYLYVKTKQKIYIKLILFYFLTPICNLKGNNLKTKKNSIYTSIFNEFYRLIQICMF